MVSIVGLVLAMHTMAGPRQSASHPPSELFGTWRGTSTCTDRVAAPACQDETVVYEFTAGKKADTVHWRADKVVNGRRDLMGELDLVYNADARCWSAEFASPRVHIVWCLTLTGTHISGTAALLPGKENVRKVDVDKQ